MNWYAKLMNKVRLPQESKKQSKLELTASNLKIGTIFLYFVALFQLVNVFYVTVFRTERISRFPGNIYLSLYILMFLLCCCFLIKIHFLKRNIKKNVRVIEGLTISFLTFILFWSTTISLLDLRNTENINVHIYTMLAVVVTLYVNPKIFISILVADYIYFISCFTLFQRTQVNNVGNLLNATIVLCIAIIIVCFRYYERIDSFIQNQTIIKQNKVIKDRNAELKKLAITDTLSGLYNRRLLDAALTDKWEECSNQKINFCLIMIDIDNFKNVNDTFGHLCGDACIASIADSMRECTEETEAMSFRYGGEEFAILLSNYSVEQMYNLSEMIRLHIEKNPIICAEEGTVLYITVSIGFCCDIPHKDSNYFEYISMADMALRTAKQNGKNQVQRSEWKNNKIVMYE